MSWKEASSVILLALKERPFSSFYNYNFLMLKRSKKNSFMPNLYVFPGGTVDLNDSEVKWRDIFIDHGYRDPFIHSNIPESNLPPIMKMDSQSLISKQVSLRITAIRETFEETGILLCKTRDQKQNLPWSTVHISPDVLSWRLKVQNDPSQFYNLCKSFECIPDIWSLKMWSNWLTPSQFKKRFDTVFFIACLPEAVQCSADRSEICEMKWYSPELLLKESRQNLLLPPPQFYELSRIMRFHMLEDLARFAADREGKGGGRIESMRLKTVEGSIIPMPGDEAYGEKDVERYSKCTFLEARKESQHLNRIEIFKSLETRIISNNSLYGHVMPITH